MTETDTKVARLMNRFGGRPVVRTGRRNSWASRRKVNRLSVLALLLGVLVAGACSSPQAPTRADRDEVSTIGHAEVETHLGDPWVSALDHPELIIRRDWVTPRRFDRDDGPSYFESPTQYDYLYHPLHSTSDLETIRTELVAALEGAGASVEEVEPFENTPEGGSDVSRGTTATLSVDSLGNSLTIFITYVEFEGDNDTNFIRHVVLVND